MTEQPRERAVPCQRCRRDTWNISAVCDDCAKKIADGVVRPSAQGTDSTTLTAGGRVSKPRPTPTHFLRDRSGS